MTELVIIIQACNANDTTVASECFQRRIVCSGALTTVKSCWHLEFGLVNVSFFRSFCSLEVTLTELAVVLVWRTYAIYERSKKVLYLIGGLWLVRYLN